MKAASLDACLRHWSKRVENGHIAFRFKAVEDSHKQDAKTKKKRPEPPTDDEDDNAKTKKKRLESPTDDEDDNDTKSGAATDPVDGDPESSEDAVNPVQEATGAGKAKAVPRLWYD
jgi:hypothetical protein